MSWILIKHIPFSWNLQSALPTQQEAPHRLASALGEYEQLHHHGYAILSPWQSLNAFKHDCTVCILLQHHSKLQHNIICVKSNGFWSTFSGILTINPVTKLCNRWTKYSWKWIRPTVRYHKNTAVCHYLALSQLLLFNAQR